MATIITTTSVKVTRDEIISALRAAGLIGLPTKINSVRLIINEATSKYTLESDSCIEIIGISEPEEADYVKTR